jgi:hypothetical protein
VPIAFQNSQRRTPVAPFVPQNKAQMPTAGAASSIPAKFLSPNTPLRLHPFPPVGPAFVAHGIRPWEPLWPTVAVIGGRQLPSLHNSLGVTMCCRFGTDSAVVGISFNSQPSDRW